VGRLDCTALLRSELPKLGLDFDGYFKVRRLVCSRLDTRRQELGLGSVADYQGFLNEHPEERVVFRRLCLIEVSRFYRDARVWDRLRGLLPSLAPIDGPARAWVCGCAAGEEAWTLRLIAALDPEAPELNIVATDVDDKMLFRARAGRYPAGALRELPSEWRAAGFHRSADGKRLLDEHRHGVSFLQQDLLKCTPAGQFDLVCCRNLAFTFFDQTSRTQALQKLLGKLRPGGLLLLGRDERLSPRPELLLADAEIGGLYRHAESTADNGLTPAGP